MGWNRLKRLTVNFMVMAVAISAVAKEPDLSACEFDLANVVRQIQDTDFFLPPEELTGWGRYQIDLDQAFGALRKLARADESLYLESLGDWLGDPVYKMTIPSRRSSPRFRIVFVAGVHGNESVGVSALIKFLAQFSKSKWRDDIEIVAYPALNTSGLRINSRYIFERVDANRFFVENSEFELTQMVMADMQFLKGRADALFDLHEAFGRPGFFSISHSAGAAWFAKMVMAKLPHQWLFRSPSGQYPYFVRKRTGPVPRPVVYDFHADGIATSHIAGTLKGFGWHELNIPISDTLEVTAALPLRRREAAYVRWLKEIVFQFLSLP